MLACGGFQANAAMMREHFGDGGDAVPLLAPRAHFNSGDGIRMARALGADLSGEPDGMHIEPVDPRSKNQAAVVLLYPYGIVVDRDGRRFFDEGAGLVHETWEAFSRRLHFEVPGRMAYAILDARVRAIPDWQRATRSEVPPFEAATLAELAKLIGVDADNLARTVAAYNAACTGDPQKFDATLCDGLAASRFAHAAEIELGARHRRAAVPRLADDRRHRLHLRRACDRRPRPRAARRRADPRPLRRRRDHRAFLRHRAERGVGAARVRVRPDRRDGRRSGIAWRRPVRPGIQRHCEERSDEAISADLAVWRRLLRFARNDAVGRCANDAVRSAHIGCRSTACSGRGRAIPTRRRRPD